MEKTTILAKLRLTIRFSEAAHVWLRPFEQNSNVWFARDGGTRFLAEFGGTWDRTFKDEASPVIREYFADRGVPQGLLPEFQIEEHYRGSWVIEAAVVMFTTVGTAYTILKGIAELPELADGLTELKGRILKRVRPRIEKEAREHLQAVVQHQAQSPTGVRIGPPPKQLTETELVIDARPLMSLTPSVLKTHRVHLSVGVSRDSFGLENLGDEPIHNVRIGLFRTESERHQWSLADAYVTSVPLLSCKQTLSKSVADFVHANGSRFDLSDGEPVYVDAWVEDSHGIYLFRFFLERE